MNFDAKSKNVTASYSTGDTVGIQIHEVDRTNTSSRLLPCKILDVNDDNQSSNYTLYTKKGKIKNTFQAEDLVDMRNVHFPGLHETDIDGLPELSLIQASRLHTAWNPIHISNGSTVCTCKGKCTTIKCKCKKANLSCSNKCHPHSTMCRNKINHKD